MTSCVARKYPCSSFYTSLVTIVEVHTCIARFRKESNITKTFQDIIPFNMKLALIK